MQTGVDNFHLIDLASQRHAVKWPLRDWTASEKLAWLMERGEVLQTSQGPPDTYRFRSRLGFEVAFFFRDEQFVFIGYDTTSFVFHSRSGLPFPKLMSCLVPGKDPEK